MFKSPMPAIIPSVLGMVPVGDAAVHPPDEPGGSVLADYHPNRFAQCAA